MMPHILHIIQLALRQRCNRGEIGSVAPNLNGKDEMTMGGTVKWVEKNEYDATTPNLTKSQRKNDYIWHPDRLDIGTDRCQGASFFAAVQLQMQNRFLAAKREEDDLERVRKKK